MIEVNFSARDIDRFWSKVIFYHIPEVCWIWGDKLRPDGYGEFTFDYIDRTHRSIKLAHIFSYELANNISAKGKVVRHTCNNPKCVNPKHLLLGTQKDNMADKKKGPVDRNRVSNYTQADIDAVKAEIAAGRTHREIAKDYCMSTATVSFIKNNKVRVK